MSIFKRKRLLSFCAVLVLFINRVIRCSEFPERECCDLTTTTTVGPIPIPPAIPTVKIITTSSSQAIPTGRSGSNIKTAIAILNCILARQLCFEDPSCSAILEIISRVCGPVPVACSTVTVTKCQAALRTLQAFPFFRPTCLCKEPGVDPDCNIFRDFLFDHPCGFVSKKEKDPFPVDALPTCNHALSVCQHEKICNKVYEDFKLHCKVRDNKCKMEDRQMCHESWSNLRMSPMFGCICPNNHMKRRCDRIFSIVNHNPCVGSQDESSESNMEETKLNFQSTCHTALNTCQGDSSCLKFLQPILTYCDLHRCNRKACMKALQSFYKAPHEDLSLDVAFCLCRKTGNRHDPCMLAQEKLHPVCAQKPPENMDIQPQNGIVYLSPLPCHHVAELCKENTDCRAKLEYYEQACAVDSVTRKCAGKSSFCRSAMLGILGTQLRMSCSCHGTEFPQLYECIGWQRLLWINPCVVESQKDFHVKRLSEMDLTVTGSANKTIMFPTLTPFTTSFKNLIEKKQSIKPFDTESPTDIPVETNDIELLVENENYFKESIGHVASNGEATSETTLIPEVEITTAMTTTSIPTTVTASVTTKAPRNCIVQRPYKLDQLIMEGNSRRIFSSDDKECSELCTCVEPLTLTCHALCVPFVPCRTSLAFYNHASPAYQAFRGRCLCYSGRFICMRPPPGDYFLPGGVFLLMGYSSADEALLKQHTNLGVQDSVRALQNYIISEIDNQTSCTLTLFNITDENIIVSARLPQDTRAKSIKILQQEKEECASILNTVSRQINAEYNELQSHRLLSIFKMSEVQVIWPEVSGSSKLEKCKINFNKPYIFIALSITWLLY